MSPEPREGFDPSERAPWEMSFSATDLMARVFPPVVYTVTGIVVPGLTLIAGPPKIGKSWMVMNIATAVSSGGRALGRIPVDKAEVLYLALEDPPRRLQERLAIVLEGEPVPNGLHFSTEWPLMHDGGADHLHYWLNEHRDAGLIVVDVLAKVRGSVSQQEARYDADYRAMTLMKNVADMHNVAIVVLHHTRKALAEDFVDTVSGTNGLAGAADTVAVLARSRGSADATLNVTGRDVPEATMALTLKDGRWMMLDGPASDYETTEERRRILNILRDRPGLTPKVISASTGLDHGVVRHLVRKMVGEGQIETNGSGAYSTPVHSIHSVHSSSEQSEQSEWVYDEAAGDQ